MQKFKNAKGAEYTLTERDKGGFTLTRVSTGSTESISQKLIDKTTARLEAGEAIPFRKINYTVAVEQAVLFLLRDIVHIDPFSRTYTKR